MIAEKCGARLEASLRPTQGRVMLDIGGNHGALIIVAPPSLAENEIEICPTETGANRTPCCRSQGPGCLAGQYAMRAGCRILALEGALVTEGLIIRLDGGLYRKADAAGDQDLVEIAGSDLGPCFACVPHCCGMTSSTTSLRNCNRAAGGRGCGADEEESATAGSSSATRRTTSPTRGTFCRSSIDSGRAHGGADYVRYQAFALSQERFGWRSMDWGTVGRCSCELRPRSRILMVSSGLGFGVREPVSL